MKTKIFIHAWMTHTMVHARLGIKYHDKSCNKDKSFSLNKIICQDKDSSQDKSSSQDKIRGQDKYSSLDKILSLDKVLSLDKNISLASESRKAWCRKHWGTSTVHKACQATRYPGLQLWRRRIKEGSIQHPSRTIKGGGLSVDTQHQSPEHHSTRAPHPSLSSVVVVVVAISSCNKPLRHCIIQWWR